jgi:hypothetical protein
VELILIIFWRDVIIIICLIIIFELMRKEGKNIFKNKRKDK